MGKEFWHWVLVLLAVFAFQFFLYRSCSREKVEPEQIEIHDTTIVCKYVDYNWSHLKPMDVEFVSPDIPKMCFYDITKVKTEVINDTTFIVLPRESKYLKKDNVQIWYSGVDPSIDRLLIEQQYKEITKTIKEPWKRNEISLYGSAGYDMRWDASVGFRYKYELTRHFYVSSRVEYHPLTKQLSAMADLGITLVRF